jgi:hypothetical protein
MGREKIETCTNAQPMFGVERRLEKVGALVYQNNSVRAQLAPRSQLSFVCRERRIGCSGDLLQDEIVLFGLLAGKFCWLFRIIWGENSKADLKKSLHSIIRFA